MKIRTSKLDNLAFSARHSALSTIVITQQLTSIESLTEKLNISRLVIFYNPSAKDSQFLLELDDYRANVEKNERGEMMKSKTLKTTTPD